MARLGRLAGRHGLPISFVITVVVAVVISRGVDRRLVADAFGRAFDRPGPMVLALSAFALAFVLRTVAWARIVPGLGVAQAWSGIHVALGANHVLPLRLGEPLRVVSVVRRAGISAEIATASTVTLRAADVLTMVVIGLAVSPQIFIGLIGPFGWALLGVLGLVAVLSWRWLLTLATGSTGRVEGVGVEGVGVEGVGVEGVGVEGVGVEGVGVEGVARTGGAARSRRAPVVMPGPGVIGLAAAAWLAESVVVWEAARWVGLELGWSEAVLVATVAVAAQIAAVTPGGLGTYEAASVAAYLAIGIDPEVGLVAALGAHGLKTAYSLVTGAIAVVLPAPGLLGRFRLARHDIAVSADTTFSPGAVGPPFGIAAPAPGVAGSPSDMAEAPSRRDDVAPVLLFMPAFNEEASVATCVRRAPTQVLGRPVEVLVVDDGSTDGTAAVARTAGAEVMSMGFNRGLGAAVRVGLAEGVRRGSSAVAFCDADGEYPPEELASLVAPILADDADYVTGSRFLGRIDHMRPHRRFGNVVLTAVLSVVARTRISDGQSGYRAFSPRAAASAEIIHDFNYAQVLTLDLLAKGHRLREVPISYRFRSEGESFIRLGRYLRHVVPAVYRELNAG